MFMQLSWAPNVLGHQLYTSQVPVVLSKSSCNLWHSFHCYHRQIMHDYIMQLWLGRCPWNIFCFFFWSQILGAILTWIPFKHRDFPPSTKHQMPQSIHVNLKQYTGASFQLCEKKQKKDGSMLFYAMLTGKESMLTHEIPRKVMKTLLSSLNEQ